MNIVMPQISAVYAALAVILVIALAFRVVFARRASRVGIGDGGDARLARHIRVHANAVENLPLALILLVLLELSGVAGLWLHVLGAGLLLARLAHAFGLGRHSGVSAGRFYGAGLSWLLMLVMAIWLLARIALWHSI